MKPVSAIERAFEIARSGRARDIAQIRKILAGEGLDQIQIYGKSLSRQLAELIRQSGALEKPKT
ncbi:hypothetical protein [Methylovirgula ligni]|uniref:hypothetical protein n=1 Tax=Methylovirgula ligni TaxID=569860 RepID=UPI003CCAC96E